jgi:Tol biopolymer transport system component
MKTAIWVSIMLLMTWVIGVASETADGHFDKARELLNAGKYKKAAEEFSAIAKLSPSGSELEQNARYWIGQCYFRMGEFDEALSTFEKLIQDYPESAVTPVTQLMMDRVQREKESKRLNVRLNPASENDVIVDPETGLKFTRMYSDEKLNLLSHNLGLIVSPDGRFLFDQLEHWVIPLKEGEEPFNLGTDKIMQTLYGSWSPDMSKFAFISSRPKNLFVVPVSPETGRPTGPVRKLIDGNSDEGFKGNYTPSWSPDSKQIAFPWLKDGNMDIWTIPAAGGEPTRITSDPLRDFMPLWSPDGKSIVFGRKRDFSPDTVWDAYIVPAEGGTPEKILDSVYVYQYGFSPDGKWLAFFRDRVKGVDIMRLSDKRQFNVAPPEEVVGGFSYGPKFAWSPRGIKLLFYNSGFEYWSTIGLVMVYGGSPMELGEGMRFNSWVQGWSSDGKFILTNDWETNDLWIVPADGGEPVKMKVETEPKVWRYAFLPFSPDLKKIAFVTEDHGLWVAPISIEEQRVIGPVVKIAEEVKGRTVAVNWSPDSKKIVFSSSKSGNADICTASAKGGDLKQLTDAPEGEGVSSSALGAWSPDGKMIVYHRARDLWIVPASGGEPREVVKEAFEPVWSPDSKQLAFLMRDNSYISAVALATGEIRHVVDLKAVGINPDEPSYGGCWGLTWSPDGEWLSFFTVRNRMGHFWVVPADGGKPRELARDHPGKWFQYWSPDSSRLSYNSDRDVKVRMGAIWEMDVAQLLGGE